MSRWTYEKFGGAAVSKISLAALYYHIIVPTCLRTDGIVGYEWITMMLIARNYTTERIEIGI